MTTPLGGPPGARGRVPVEGTSRRFRTETPLFNRYSRELDTIPETYQHAARADVRALAVAIQEGRDRALVAVGSGGALSAARLACAWHEQMTGQSARAMTPFGFLQSNLNLRETAVMCVSAGGSNRDILAAFHHALAREPASLTVLCGKAESPLLRAASRFAWVHQAKVALNARDGFLATHSTVSFSVLLFRAIVTALRGPELPSGIAGLFRQRTWSAVRCRLRDLTATLWSTRTLVVLHAPSLEASAYDIESRFTEAALANVQLSDFRNFGHGRHHWLAKMPTQSSVLSLATAQERDLAEQTLALIPQSTPQASLLVPGRGPQCGLAALVSSIILPECLAPIRQIDPAKPGVPLFGRKLYRLGALRTQAPPIPQGLPIAIQRKIDATPATQPTQAESGFWSDAHRRYVTRLAQTRFDSLVLDFDGTLCQVNARYDSLEPHIVADLVGLLQRDVVIAIATGRGNSAWEALRLAIDRTLWPKVLVGLNNGSRILRLSSDSPVFEAAQPRGLSAVWDLMNSDVLLNDIATVHTGTCTLSIRPKASYTLSDIVRRARTLAHLAPLPLCVRSSTHSVDVAPYGVSKRLVLEFIRTELGGTQPLAIGDRGDASGNDFDLLHACLSLSVDRVSSAPDYCWNLAPAALRFVAATRHYLCAIRPERGGVFRLRLPRAAPSRGGEPIRRAQRRSGGRE